MLSTHTNGSGWGNIMKAYLGIGAVLGLALCGCGDEAGGGDGIPEIYERPSLSLPADLDEAECPLGCRYETDPPECAGNILVGPCSDGERTCTNCEELGQKCAYDEVYEMASCLPLSFENPDCVPACKDKFCGDDGCGGSCGFCPDEGVCDGAQCWIPGSACGDIGVESECISDLKVSCSEGGLAILDCTSVDRVCAYNESTEIFDCLVP